MKKKLTSILLSVIITISVVPVANVIAVSAPVIITEADGTKTTIWDVGGGIIGDIEELPDNMVTLTFNLRGVILLNSFGLYIHFDTAKLLPCDVATKTELPINASVETAANVAPYIENLASTSYLKDWIPSVNSIISNSGKYFVLGYSRGTGINIGLNSGIKVPLFKMYFRKQTSEAANINMFTYSGADRKCTFSYGSTLVRYTGKIPMIIRNEAFMKTFTNVVTEIESMNSIFNGLVNVDAIGVLTPSAQIDNIEAALASYRAITTSAQQDIALKARYDSFNLACQGVTSHKSVLDGYISEVNKYNIETITYSKKSEIEALIATGQAYVSDDAIYIASATANLTDLLSKIISLTPLSDISLTKTGSDFEIKINDWKPSYKYQIWTYQKIESGIFDGVADNTNQWVLSMSYNLGSDRTTSGFVENADGSLSKNIDSFISNDDNYIVAVKILDENDQYVKQIRDTFTEEQVENVKIKKVLVDKKFHGGNSEIKEIKSGALVEIDVIGNGVADVTYNATIKSGSLAPITLTPGGISGNKFIWDISDTSGLTPGRYTVTVNATKGLNIETREIPFDLYKTDASVQYGDMPGMTATGAIDPMDSSKFMMNINPIIARNSKFYYNISEPWRAAFFKSNIVDATIGSGNIFNKSIQSSQYGVYQVTAFVKRNNSESVDDGAIKTVVNKRPGTHAINVTANGNTVGAATIEWIKGQQLNFVSTASFEEVLPENTQYSYWRRDANGWVLIRDYETSGVLTWSPSHIGKYTIQVRAKGAGAGSYELSKSIEINVTASGEEIAAISSITVNLQELEAVATARTPILISAIATANTDELLYKYIISNEFIYYVETSYSPDPTYVWLPAKAGEYKISVLIKNKVSFGKYDGMQTFTVNVNQ